MAAEAFWGFDVGNTRVKAGVVSNGQVDEADWSLHAQPGELAALVARCRARHAKLPAVICSVNTPVSDQLLGLLAEHGIDVEQVHVTDGGLFRSGLLESGVETPTATGVDRVLSARAAWERTGGKAVVVVDCGSAVTVNLTSARRVFQGGAILPGWALMASALHRGTALLPRVPVGETPAAIGTTTAGAIGSGIFHALVGGIDRLVDKITAEAVAGGAGAPEVLVTGGAAALLGPGLHTPHSVAPHLVLEGLWYAQGRPAEPGHARL